MSGCSNLCGGIFKKIEILNPVVSQDDEGYVNNGNYSIIETIVADVQPLSGEIAANEFGITDRACSEILFITQSVNNLTKNKDEGRLIVVNENDTQPFEVMAIREWGISKDVPIKPYNAKINVVRT